MEEVVIYPAWKRLSRIASMWEYGTFHPHSEIEEILEIKKDQKGYHRAIDRAKLELLQEDNKWLINSFGAGYSVCQPDEFPDEVLKGVNKAYRRMKRAIKISDNAPIEDMSVDALMKLRNIRDRVGRSAAMIKQDRVEIKRVLIGKVIVINKD